jgi:hypothetical protein
LEDKPGQKKNLGVQKYVLNSYKIRETMCKHVFKMTFKSPGFFHSQIEGRTNTVMRVLPLKKLMCFVIVGSPCLLGITFANVKMFKTKF